MSGPRLRLLALVLFAVCVWALYLKVWFVGFFGDPVWYLEPARNFALGRGLVTRTLLTAQLADFPPGVTMPAPFLFHGPLSLIVIGLGYRLFGVVDWVPLAYSFSLMLATGLLVYRLGREIEGERAGLLGAGLYWTSALGLDRQAQSLADPLFTALVVSSFACLWESAKPRRSALRWLACSGLLLGLASCTRLAGQSYWLGFALGAWWLHGRSWRRAGALLLCAAPPLVVLAFYNQAAAGKWFYSPGFYLLYWSHSFPGGRAVTSFLSLTTPQALLQYPRDVFQKMLTGPFYAASRFIEDAKGPYAAALVFFGLLSDVGRGSAAGRFQALLWFLLIPVLAVNIAVSYGGVAYLQPLAPLMLLMAAICLGRFVERNRAAFPFWGWAAGPLLAFVLLSPLALEIKQAWKTKPARAALYGDQVLLGEFIKSRTRPDEVLYSDDPATVAWHGERSCVALTATLEDARKAFARLAPGALVVTSLRVGSEDYDEAWRKALHEKAPVLGFAAVEEFRSATVSAVLLRPAKKP